MLPKIYGLKKFYIGWASKSSLDLKTHKESKDSMKRIGYLYDKLLDKEYIKETIMFASKHKTSRRSVKTVLNDIDHYVNEIYEMIKNNKIELKPTHSRVIHERGKDRTITISPFYPNQIFDYLLTNTVKPIIKKSLYQYCVGNIDGKGIVYGKRYIEKHIKNYKYFIKLDIHHFYQSVNTQKLISKLETKVKDKKFIEFARQIVDKNELPIGCYYSQWLSNFYLTELDHFIKEELHIPIYVRYVDDMLLIGNNKRKLRTAMFEIKKWLENNGLELKRIEQVKAIDKLHPVSFLGFKYYKTHTYLRNAIFKRLNHTIKKVKIHVCNSLIERMFAYLGWLKQIKCGYVYYKRNIKPIIKLGYIRWWASANL